MDQYNIDVVLPSPRKYNVGVLAKRPIANSAWRRIGRVFKSLSAVRQAVWEPGLRL